MKTVTGQVSITISPEDEKEIALEYLCKEFGWSKEHFIEEGYVKRDMINHTTHAWEEVETVREADDTDKAMNLLLSQLEL